MTWVQSIPVRSITLREQRPDSGARSTSPILSSLGGGAADRWLGRRLIKSGLSASAPVAEIGDRTHDDGMATLTLYRPIGTVEEALIVERGWASFPDMPSGFGFYAYSQFIGDPREWPRQIADPEYYEALEYGQRETVESWASWGNARDDFSVVWFEVDEGLQPALHRPLSVDAVNSALVGRIEVCARYRPSLFWVNPRLS